MAFLALALMWWVESESTDSYGMTGRTTTITLVDDAEVGADERPTPEKQIEAARDLRSFLEEQRVSMVKVSEGDSAPTLVVLDPDHELGWTEPLDTAESDSGLYTISGSYSDRLRSTTGRTPLAPEGATVLGGVEVPGTTPSNSNLQFVEVLGNSPVGPGTLLLGTTDPDTVSHAVDLLEASGVQAVNPQRPPLLLSLARDAAVSIAAVFVLVGIVCSMASVALRLPERHDELRLRLLVGATGSALVREHARDELAPTLVGTTLGAGAAVVLTSLIAGSPPDGRELGVVGAGALGGTFVVWLARQAAFTTAFVYSRRNSRRNGSP